MARWAAVVIALISGLLSIAWPAFAIASSIPPYVLPEHAVVLEQWLRANPSYRPATDADCSCASDIYRMRTESVGVWRANPQFHPYYVVGDFNWDGILDFAVGVIDAAQREQFKVVLFHGPFGSQHRARAAFVSAPFNLGQGLFFGDPRPVPHMLVVGPFESEGAVLRPSFLGYTWESAQ